jgi:putative amidase-like protein
MAEVVSSHVIHDLDYACVAGCRAFGSFYNGGTQMKRRQLLVATSLAGAAAAAGVPRAAFAAGKDAVDLSAADLAEIKGVVQQYLQARADAVTRPGSKMSAGWLQERTTAGLTATVSYDFDRLGHTRELVTNIHGGYSGAATVVDIVGAEAVGGDVALDVSERTKIFYAVRSGADADAYQQRLDHRMVVRKEGGRWRLAEAHFLAGSGVPPLTQFDGYLSAAAPSGVAPAGVARRATKRSLVKRAGTVSKSSPSGAVSAAYNYTAMANYAVQWAYSRNPRYPNFANIGGDCTCFVSQCMQAGGWQIITGADNSQWHVWFYYGTNPNNASFTWGGAEPWYWFASYYSERTYILEYLDQLAYADVLQYDWTANNVIDHTQICHGYSSDGDWYMAQHNTDYSHSKLSEILARVYETYPNVWFYAHRT